MNTITQDTFHQYKFLSNLNSNPSQTMAAFIESRINTKKNNYDKNLYLTNGENCKLFMKDVKNYFFLNDDSILVLDHKTTSRLTNKGYEFSSYKLVDIKTKEVVRTFSWPLLVSNIRKISETTYLIQAQTNLDAPRYFEMSASEREEIINARRNDEDYQVIDEYPYYFNGIGFINKTRSSLFLFDINTEELTKISNDTMDVEYVDVMDDKIAFSAFDFKAYKDRLGEAYEYNMITKETTQLYSKKDFMIQRFFFHRGEYLLTGTFCEKIGAMQNCAFYSLKNNELSLYLDNDTSLYPSVGSDCRYGQTKDFMNTKDGAYIVTTMNGTAPLCCLKDREFVPVIKENGTVDDFTMINGKFYVIGMFDTDLQEVYCYDGSLSKISSFNKKIMSTYYVATPNPIVVENDGYNIEGWYLLPPNYDKNNTYPAILDIHGGPKTAYGAVFYHEMQYWASLGYIVFFCNPRGSDGRGNDYVDLRGVMGKKDFSDFMKFTDEVLELLPIDKSNVAVTGGSYGGYMTNWIIGHTNRFKCAASQRSISNWISMVTGSDYGLDFPFQQDFKDIRNCHDEMWDCSPLKYANNIETPTLFIHSFEDYRCPIAEAYQIYTTMKARGIDSRICAFKGENHDLSRNGKPLHRSRRLHEITSWIMHYTKNSL